MPDRVEGAMTTTAAATAMAEASATAMGGAQTTIKLSYRNGGGCSWATAGRRLGDGDGTATMTTTAAATAMAATSATAMGGAQTTIK